MNKKILVEVSARHLHLSAADAAELFGADHDWKILKTLSQPGEVAYQDKVSLLGPNGQSLTARVLGPWRAATQVELAASDAATLGISAPVKLSGDHAGSAGLTLQGPAGTIALTQGVIMAKRHLHLSPSEASELGLHQGQLVRIKLDNEHIIDDIVVRLGERYRLALHLDTDEAKAAGLERRPVSGELLN